jgi:hypothetical protein
VKVLDSSEQLLSLAKKISTPHRFHSVGQREPFSRLPDASRGPYCSVQSTAAGLGRRFYSLVVGALESILSAPATCTHPHSCDTHAGCTAALVKRLERWRRAVLPCIGCEVKVTLPPPSPLFSRFAIAGLDNSSTTHLEALPHKRKRALIKFVLRGTLIVMKAFVVSAVTLSRNWLGPRRY